MNNQPSLSKFIKLLLYTLTQWLGQEKANRDAIAKTTVRVSLKTKRPLQGLKSMALPQLTKSYGIIFHPKETIIDQPFIQQGTSIT